MKSHIGYDACVGVNFNLVDVFVNARFKDYIRIRLISNVQAVLYSVRGTPDEVNAVFDT